jgi:hypothetical protein
LLLLLAGLFNSNTTYEMQWCGKCFPFVQVTLLPLITAFSRTSKNCFDKTVKSETQAGILPV